MTSIIGHDATEKASANDMYQTITMIDSVIRPLIPMFLEQSQLRITALADAVTNRDYTTVKKIAHTMKGSASSYGFNGMATIARDVEDMLRVDPVDHDLMQEKVREFQRMHDAAQAVVSNHPELFEEE